jgi:L-amino acid N-acyltransferase YncA
MKHGSIELDPLSLRVGKPADVEPLLRKYGLDHFTEGGFDAFAEWDLERAIREMTKQVARSDTPFIVATVGGEDVGWISWYFMHTFTRRPIACLWTIYVNPEQRRSAVGQRLIWAAMDLARIEGACAFFATVAPTGLGGQALCRLFQGFGFEPMAGAFSKRLN